MFPQPTLLNFMTKTTNQWPSLETSKIFLCHLVYILYITLRMGINPVWPVYVLYSFSQVIHFSPCDLQLLCNLPSDENNSYESISCPFFARRPIFPPSFEWMATRKSWCKNAVKCSVVHPTILLTKW